jgi:hypothetical protein
MYRSFSTNPAWRLIIIKYLEMIWIFGNWQEQRKFKIFFLVHLFTFERPRTRRKSMWCFHGKIYPVTGLLCVAVYYRKVITISWPIYNPLLKITSWIIFSFECVEIVKSGVTFLLHMIFPVGYGIIFHLL